MAPPPRMHGDGRMAKNPKKTLLRLLSYLKHYWFTLVLVMACIFATAFTQSRSSTALGKLVDEFILPMVETGSADSSPLWNFLVQLACIFAIGLMILASGLTMGYFRYKKWL